MEQQITVKREGEFEYKIVFANSFAELIDSLCDISLTGMKACIVTDSNVDSLYANEVLNILKPKFKAVTKFVIPAGEQNKTLDTVRKLYTHLIDNQIERKDILIAVGGGVVGDLTGFVAATYLRGIDFVQVPTTLLSQVDSSVGGKTGVDFDNFKNMVGAFLQPRLVYMNMATLSTLSQAEFACGMGEILKTGLLNDGDYFKWVIDNEDKVKARESDVLATMIKRSCQIKANIVEEDPYEKGVRALLNLGHTLGHAIEKLKNFEMLHGQCVAVGTVAAAYLSTKKGYLTTSDLESIKAANRLYDLPVKVAGLTPKDILKVSKSDKKMEEGKIKFILLRTIGEAFVDNSITDKELEETISYIVEN